MIPYGVLFVFCQILAEIRAKLFLEKPITYRPAESLRCLPVSAVRPILHLNLQSDHTQFLYFALFCFFRWRTAVSCFSSIDQFQLVCFAGCSLPPFFRGCPPLLSLRDISPHRGESPSPSSASSTAVACGVAFAPPFKNGFPWDKTYLSNLHYFTIFLCPKK